MGAPLNILLIVADGVRADHLSCYGYGRATTPALDRLAREGVRFTNMFSTSPATLPAHASLFTGMHAVTHGATSEHPQLRAASDPLALRLRAAGYRTAAFSTNPWVSPEYGFAAGFDAFFTQRYHSPLANRAMAFGRRTADRLLRRSDGGARRTNVALSRWLAASDRPFFAFVHFNEAHLPVLAPPPFERLFLDPSEDLERARALNAEIEAHAATTEADRHMLIGLYDGAVRYVDQSIGELGEALRIAGMWENTLVIITADHGESFGEHGAIGHRVGLYDELLHVPLIMRCPDHVPSGFVVDELSQTTDILPTVLGMLEIDAAPVPKGARQLLRDGRVLPGPEFVVSERFRPAAGLSEADHNLATVRMKAIRTRRDKFIWRSDESNELYDLVSDPREQRNLIETSTRRADLLRRQLFDWLSEVEAFEMPPEVQERAMMESRA